MTKPCSAPRPRNHSLRTSAAMFADLRRKVLELHRQYVESEQKNDEEAS